MEHRPFPPSPRRLALARRAGLHATSPLLVAALACAAALVAVIVTARAAAAEVGAWIAAACGGHSTLAASGVTSGVLALAAPVVAAAAVLALVAHVAQSRRLWLPRRKLDGAPALPRRRVATAAFEVGGPAVVGAVCVGWLWLVAPRLASLFGAGEPLAAVGALLASFVAALVCAWAGLGVLDALARHFALRAALAMTAAEKREDDRLAAADPRWRARRSDAARAPSITGAVVVVLGDTAAVAIAWDPARQPVPARVAVGRGARAGQLVALARRDRIAIHRDTELAAALGAGDGAVPESAWPRLAEIVAAVRGR